MNAQERVQGLQPLAPGPSGQRSLARKVAEIVAAVSYVPKAGHNDHFNYSFAQESDVLAAVRGEMARRHLALFPNVVHHAVREVQGKSGILYVTTLTVAFTLEDGESGEVRTVTVIGEGEDNHDKGANKALTAAAKYAALKLFLIPTGRDPDGDAPAEEVPRGGQSRPAPPAPQQQRQAPAQQPGGSLPMTFPPFGRLKGQPIRGAAPKDLEFYAGAAKKSLADQSKSRFHDKERANLEAYREEMRRQNAAKPADTPPGGEPDPRDYGSPMAGGLNDDAPF